MTSNETRRFLRRPEVESVTGLSSSTIYAKIKTGDFPKPFPLGPCSVAWLDSDIAAWQQKVLIAAGKVAA
jgi:prophage regulatory protein